MGDATGNGVGDLQVLDSMSNSVSVWERVVLDIGPTAALNLSVEYPEEGMPFHFIDESVGYDAIVSWVWTLTYPDLSEETRELDPEAMSQVMFVVDDGEYSMRLDVYEPDGDTDEFVLEFTVSEISPLLTLTLSPPGGSYLEFQSITFMVGAESQDPVVLHEWDFDAPSDEFVPDIETEVGETSYAYGGVGNYTAKVRVTDSDGSIALQSIQLEILDAGLSGTFDDVVVTRDPEATYNVSFDMGALVTAYPDITSAVWEFGDGESEHVSSALADPATHEYSPTRDYVVNLTVFDDDGNSIEMSATLHMVEPVISLGDPGDGAFVSSGTLIEFNIGDDSLPLANVQYSVNGGAYQDFETAYAISTEGWEDGTYTIDVMAEDKDGNIAHERGITVTIDDTAPVVTLLFDSERAYGGDKVNITISVTDANVDPGEVVLLVTFPGDDSPTSINMAPAGDGVFYALVEVPKRTGTMEFYVEVSDLAGNSMTSETFSVPVELRLMDAAWPFLLAIAIVAALGTGVYFMREVTIAVDETFVIYSDGRLLAHSTRRLKPGMDDQILSGMFVAVQDFIRDSFKDETSFKLRKLGFGEKTVLVEKGEHLFLAVVLHGKVSKKVARRMKVVLDDIEDAFSEHLADWDGDLDKVRGVSDMVKMLYSKAPVLPCSIKRKEA
jgi:hypothetical protein